MPVTYHYSNETIIKVSLIKDWISKSAPHLRYSCCSFTLKKYLLQVKKGRQLLKNMKNVALRFVHIFVHIFPSINKMTKCKYRLNTAEL